MSRTLKSIILFLNLLILLAALSWLAACEDEPQSAGTADADPVPAAGATLSGTGYMTFAVNVHDTVHIDESADTILQLIDIFERHGVRGDFYLTAPVTALYESERPDVIERLKESGMTISYHVRPPHPLYEGFDAALAGLGDAALAQSLLDYETYALDMATGGLDRGAPGGYGYVAATFGRYPVVASAPNNDRRIKSAAEQNFVDLGAKMTVHYHEEGTDPDVPFEWANGLLVRPSDFSVTRWGDPGKKGKEPFWWNMLTGSDAASYDPAAYLQQRLEEWWAGQPARPPFVTALIHENNFYRSGPEGWTSRYYTSGDKTVPLSPPFDLDAPDLSKPRSAQEQELIWTAYEEMVAWAAANMEVVTSEDILKMAERPL